MVWGKTIDVLNKSDDKVVDGEAWWVRFAGAIFYWPASLADSLRSYILFLLSCLPPSINFSSLYLLLPPPDSPPPSSILFSVLLLFLSPPVILFSSPAPLPSAPLPPFPRTCTCGKSLIWVRNLCCVITRKRRRMRKGRNYGNRAAGSRKPIGSPQGCLLSVISSIRQQQESLAGRIKALVYSLLDTLRSLPMRQC